MFLGHLASIQPVLQNHVARFFETLPPNRPLPSSLVFFDGKISPK